MARALIAATALGALASASAGCVGAIDDLVIEDNPHSTISPIVRWTTATPGSTAVEFCRDGGRDCRRMEIGGQDREHVVAVAGMRADATYQVTALTVTEDGEELRSAPQAWTTGPLPYAWMAGEVDVADPAADDGWTLTNVATGVFGPVVVVMLDPEGQPVWYRVYGDDQGRADIEAALLDGERVLIGPGVAGGTPVAQVDLAGEVVWEGPVQPEIGGGGGVGIEDATGDGVMHHTLRRLPDGTYITTEFLTVDGVLGDVLTRFDAAGRVVWRWNAFEHLTVDHGELGPLGDWTHVNAVVVDDDAGLVWANSWNLDRFWAIDQDSGEVLWTAGRRGDLAPDPDATVPWFEGAHALQPVGENRWLMVDNGSHGRGWSRLLELELDLEQMTSRVAWEYPGKDGDDHWYNYAWGDVEVLPGGTLLMIAGNGVEGDDPSRLVELTRDGDILWQMWCHADADVVTGLFQATRIEALATALPDP